MTLSERIAARSPYCGACLAHMRTYGVTPAASIVPDRVYCMRCMVPLAAATPSTADGTGGWADRARNGTLPAKELGR